jgi:hypothetical protein
MCKLSFSPLPVLVAFTLSQHHPETPMNSISSGFMERGRISCIYKGGGEASLQSTIDQQQDMRASLTTGETCHSCESHGQTTCQKAQLNRHLGLE